jgi:hypothetical protein
MKSKALVLISFFLGIIAASYSQNLVVNGGIINSNASWSGQEAPFNASTYQGSYITACGNNYVMEVDNASIPTQTVNGFVSGAVYRFNCRYAYRTSCAPSVNPTILRIRFTDAPAVLDFTISIPNTVTNFIPLTFTFTNNTSTTHTLQFTNPGNANTCGVVLDDISILRFTSPGAVSTSSLSLWLKAESISQPNNSDVYAWNSLGSSALTVTAPCAARPVYRNGLASNADNLVANFNPFITFNGTSQYLAYEISRQAFLDVSSGGNGATIFEVYQGGTAGRTVFGYRGDNNSRIETKADSLVLSDGGSAGTNNNLGFSHSTRVNVVAATGKHNGLVISDLNGVNQTLSNNSADTDHLTIGVRKTSSTSAFNRFFNGRVSEFIIFNGPLSSVQMHRIRSYLGMKYGVTFGDNTNTLIEERSYESSNGTNVWSFASNSDFHNNVTIIGRDDGSALNQLRSISTDADAGSNTGSAMLDINNVNAFTADQSFLAVGHNGTVIPNPGGADFNDVPAGIQSRLRRVWKFQKTGTGVANNVTVRFDMTGFSPLTGSQLRLIVSTTTVFAGASVIAGSYAAPYFTASLPTTGGVYFTVASTNSVSTPLPVELLEFTAVKNEESVLLEWKVSRETNFKEYIVQRSENAFDFTDIGVVMPDDSEKSIKQYQFSDSKPFEGINYYRLKIVDIDNSYKFTPTKFVDFSKYEFEFMLYPNPNKGKFFLKNLNGLRIKEITVNIINPLGEVVFEDDFNFNQNQNSVDVHADLKPGVYFCKVKSPNSEKVFKFVVD